MSYEFLEHTADVKFQAKGSSLNECFKSAALALNETVRGDIKILEQEERSFEIEGKDMEILLHDFLEEFLFLLEAENFLVASVRSVEVDSLKVKCVVVGDNSEHYKFTNDVKAVTFNEMYVRQTLSDEEIGNREQGTEKWECQVVLDV